MPWWTWVLIGFALLGLELAATSFHIGFFAAGAFVVAVLMMLGWDAPLWQELIVFTFVSLVAFFFFRPVIMRRLRLHHTPPVDQLVGEQATVIEDIAAQGRGKAELRGSTWSAQNIGDTPLARGQRCTVERVEGLLLHIRG